MVDLTPFLHGGNTNASQLKTKSINKEKLNNPWDAESREILVRGLGDISMRAIEWLWEGWIPKGYITIWAGESGAGKSTVLADVAARVSTGSPWPGEEPEKHRQPSPVLWLGSEDGMEELTGPRLVACGADLNNFIEIQGVKQGNQKATFSMQDDLNSVKQILEQSRAAGFPFGMLVIDPVTSYLTGRKLRKVDLNDAGQLRTVLEPWLGVAQDYNIAIVCVTHFAKDTTRTMLHRVLGSAAFVQTCRSLCAVVSRPDAGIYAKTLIQVKVNLPEHPGGAWLFETEKVFVMADQNSGKPIYATRPKWEHLDSFVTPESVVGGARGPVSPYPVAFGMWLKTYFMGIPMAYQGLHVTQVKSAAIAAKVVTARWWDEHSGEYLEKINFGGVWWCRPKVIPVNNVK